MKVRFPVLSFLVGLIAALVAIKWHWSPLGIAVAACSFLLVFSLRMFRSRKALKDQRMGKARQQRTSISSFLRRIAVAEALGFVLIVLLAHFLFGVALRLPEPYVGKTQAIAAWPMDRSVAISQINAAITNEQYGEARGLVAKAYRKSYIDTETRDSLMSSIDKAEKPAEVITNTVVQTETVVVQQMVTPVPTPEPQARHIWPITVDVRDAKWDPTGAGPWSTTFAVKDASGQPITDLESKDFMAVVGGIRIDLTMGAGMTQGTLAPQRVAFVPDTSGSMEGVGLNPIVEGIKTFDTPEKAGWVYGLVECGGDAPRIRVGQLTNIDGILTNFDGPSGLRIYSDAKTPLFGSILEAVNIVGEGGHVVVFTDGANTSFERVTKPMVIDAAVNAGVTIHTIGLQTPDYDAYPLQRMAEATGGVYLDTPDPAAIAGLFGEVADSLFAYSISGYSTSAAPKIVIGANNAVIDLFTGQVTTDPGLIRTMISYRR